MKGLVTNIAKLGRILDQHGSKPYFGFTRAHDSLTGMTPQSVMQVTADAVPQFETMFATLIGPGRATAFATARMGFYAILARLDVGPGDEVVLQGATCAVMANAVLRCGATPVYADIDPVTYGSDASAIARVMTPRTKVIVAQHSFGIPCDIAPIRALADAQDVFLIEDCALTFGSKRDGQTVGTFGHAALFSTDHTKPVNTLSGGLIYTEDTALADDLAALQKQSPVPSPQRQHALARQVLFEAAHAGPLRFGKLRLKSLIRRKFFRLDSGFFDQDFGDQKSAYRYPQQMPAFLAAIGLQVLKTWQRDADERMQVGEEICAVLRATGYADQVQVYADPALDIVPLRIAFHAEDAPALCARLQPLIDTNAFWFREALVEAAVDANVLGYHLGSCPRAEAIAPLMINLPCNLGAAANKQLISALTIALGPLDQKG